MSSSEAITVRLRRPAQNGLLAVHALSPGPRSAASTPVLSVVPEARPRQLDESALLASAAMERYSQGDDHAFEELYRLLAPRLLRLCTYLGGRNDAEELMQEVFLKMHRARATFVPEGSVVAWSFAIARTTFLDRMRRRKRRPEAPLEPSQLESRAATAASNPESVASRHALERVLEQQLAMLSESLRSAHVLVKLEGMSCADAGAVLGVSTSAIKQRVHRASEDLKTALTQSGW